MARGTSYSSAGKRGNKPRPGPTTRLPGENYAIFCAVKPDGVEVSKCRSSCAHNPRGTENAP